MEHFETTLLTDESREFSCRISFTMSSYGSPVLERIEINGGSPIYQVWILAAATDYMHEQAHEEIAKYREQQIEDAR